MDLVGRCYYYKPPTGKNSSQWEALLAFHFEERRAIMSLSFSLSLNLLKLVKEHLYIQNR